MPRSVSPTKFPISRDPPEGGTVWGFDGRSVFQVCFQFLGIPPKGEQLSGARYCSPHNKEFPISRDPPEGGTREEVVMQPLVTIIMSFQFLGIPPKGEHQLLYSSD